MSPALLCYTRGMDAKFWKEVWEQGRAGWHLSQFNPKLLEYFPLLDVEKGQKILVPLCGKTKDLLWLKNIGLKVHGIELHEPAIKDFFAENQLPAPKINRDENFIHYEIENLVISCGDFFKLAEEKSYDMLYDRAALVALPPAMRIDYSKVLLKSLKPKAQGLLIAYEYDPARMEGPPFNVREEEIRKLYGHQFTIKLLERKAPENDGTRVSTLEGLIQTIYTMKAKG